MKNESINLNQYQVGQVSFWFEKIRECSKKREKLKKDMASNEKEIEKAISELGKHGIEVTDTQGGEV